MTEPKPGYFSVYNLTTTPDSELIEALNRGQFGNPPTQTQWSSPQHQPLTKTPSAIVGHHRQSPGVLNSQYLIICDSEDWAETSILAVNLDFDGYEDATRMPIAVAGDAIPSISIGNTEWVEEVGAHSETWPKERFAVYITSDNVDHGSVIQTLNAGLKGRKSWTTGGPVCKDASTLLLKPAQAENSLEAISKSHRSVAEKEEFDPEIYIVVESAEWAKNGVQIVRREDESTEPDSCVRPAEYAAELLTWLDQGLYTWEEIKKWDK